MHILHLNNHLEWALLLLPSCSAHQLQEIWLIFWDVCYDHIDPSKLLNFAIVTHEIDSFGELRSGACDAASLSSTSDKILTELPWYVLCDLMHIFFKGPQMFLIHDAVQTGLRLKEYDDGTRGLSDLFDMLCEVRNILIFVVRMKADDRLIWLLVWGLNVVDFFYFVVLFNESLLVIW